MNRREFAAAADALVAGTLATRSSSAAATLARSGWALPAKRPFQVIENAWIPLHDGTRLGMRLWIPEGAEQRPVPVIWEYLPYGKRDGVRKRDDAHLKSPLQNTSIAEVGTVVSTQSSEDLSIREGDPNSGAWTQENMTAWKRDDWDCAVSASFELTSTAEEFRLKEVLQAKQGDREIFKREQVSTIKRELL